MQCCGCYRNSASEEFAEELAARLSGQPFLSRKDCVAGTTAMLVGIALVVIGVVFASDVFRGTKIHPGITIAILVSAIPPVVLASMILCRGRRMNAEESGKRVAEMLVNVKTQ